MASGNTLWLSVLCDIQEGSHCSVVGHRQPCPFVGASSYDASQTVPLQLSTPNPPHGRFVETFTSMSTSLRNATQPSRSVITHGFVLGFKLLVSTGLETEHIEKRKQTKDRTHVAWTTIFQIGFGCSTATHMYTYCLWPTMALLPIAP